MTTVHRPPTTEGVANDPSASPGIVITAGTNTPASVPFEEDDGYDIVDGAEEAIHTIVESPATPSVRITACTPTSILFEEDGRDKYDILDFAEEAIAVADPMAASDCDVVGGGDGGLSTSSHGAASPEPSPAASAGSGSDEMDRAVKTWSSTWQYDDETDRCTGCDVEFTTLKRKHHCRLCGNIYCNSCTKLRALIPPSSIVLAPKGGKRVKSKTHYHIEVPNASDTSTQTVGGVLGESTLGEEGAASDAYTSFAFSPDHDPERIYTYMSSGESKEVLFGNGLEERFRLARDPLRVCAKCHRQLQPLQNELRYRNSNAVRFNSIEPTDTRRLFNSPVAFTLGHEIRKAAYALNNLLPMPRRRRRMADLAPVAEDSDPDRAEFGGETWDRRDVLASVSSNMSDLDGVRIPARLLERARGVAVITVAKGGFGLAGVEFGTGLVVARRTDQAAATAHACARRRQQQRPPVGSASSFASASSAWSAPCAIGTAGMSWGALFGAQVSDHVFLLMTDAAVEMLFSDKGSIQLGADVGVAVGPVGRSVEADVGASHHGSVAHIYTYSMSKGLYAGVSLDGKVIATRPAVNEKFYGRPVSAREILYGAVPVPQAARPLYDALGRCRVYAAMTGGGNNHKRMEGGGGLGGVVVAAAGTSASSGSGIMKAQREMQQEEMTRLLHNLRLQQQWHRQQFESGDGNRKTAADEGGPQACMQQQRQGADEELQRRENRRFQNHDGDDDDDDGEIITAEDYGAIVPEGYMVGLPQPQEEERQGRQFAPAGAGDTGDERSCAESSRISDMTPDSGYYREFLTELGF